MPSREPAIGAPVLPCGPGFRGDPHVRKTQEATKANSNRPSLCLEGQGLDAKGVASRGNMVVSSAETFLSLLSITVASDLQVVHEISESRDSVLTKG